ncbi:MAG: rod shape-determining protein MreC [Clostridia bacterium]|nr:rod shape-determining protein MreC [Clostridia bacterium]MBQ5771039.1 rod shape-determining protein MreC [Clostridia bacterium]
MAKNSSFASDKKISKQKARKRRYMIYSLLVTLAAVLILYYLLSRPSGDISLVENGAGTVFTPLQRGARTVTAFIKSWFGIGQDVDIKEEVENLRIENELLNIRLNSLTEVEQENERLQVLLNAKEEYDALSPVFAKVIAKDTGVWFDTFAINRGDNDGILPNMAVVNADGLIGRVYEVGMNYSKVLTIIDPRSSVAALIGRTRDNGMMQGITTGTSDTVECYMYYLPNIANVRVGDDVFTSGLDSLFPKGLKIGSVIAISREADTLDKYAVIQPAADFSSIEEVFVLRQIVETIDDVLPSVPTATPRPVVTPVPTNTTSIYSYATQQVYDENAAWLYPTITPEPTNTPDSTVAPSATRKVPEEMWLNG